MELGVFLKKYRIIAALSGRELAQKIGLSRSALEKYENSGVMPSAKAYRQLCAYFGLPNLEAITEQQLQTLIAPLQQSPSVLSKSPLPLASEKDGFSYVELLNALVQEKDKRIRELEKLTFLLEEKIERLELKKPKRKIAEVFE